MRFMLLSCLLAATCAAAFGHGRAVGAGGAADSVAVTDSVAAAGYVGNRDMGEVVVTATRTRRLLKEVPVLTRVIGRRDMDLADATDLRELLQQELPGVEFTYSMNQRLNMNMGGFSGRSVLILVDGERLAGETMENVDFSRLDLSAVERIEIVRGAQSALYGAGAVGGVVNIITRDAAASPWALNLNARLADHREQRYGGVLTLSRGRVGNTLEFRHMSQDTYAVCRDMADACEFRNVYGGRTWNLGDRLHVRPAPGLRLAARAGCFFREQHTDADTYERARGFSSGLRADWDMSRRDRLEAALSYDQYDKSDLLRLWGRDVLDYRNVQMSVRTLYSRTMRGRDVLTAGGEYVRDFLRTYQFADGRARLQHTGALFAQYDCLLGSRWETVAAARWDCFRDAARGAGGGCPGGATSAITGKAAVRYVCGPLALRAGYSGGFRAPTLKEKYSRFNMVGDIYVTGNEALKPEYSHNLTLSAEYTASPFSLSLSASYSGVSDRISTSAPVQGGAGEYSIGYLNLPHVRVLGMELLASGRWRIGARHSLGARADYVFTREWAARAEARAYCPARPHSLNLRLDLDSRWTRSYDTTISLHGRVLSSVDYETVQMAPPYATRPVHNPAYTIWKLQLQSRLGNGLRLNLALDNIFNYAPRVYYFNSPVTLGANLMAGLSLDLDRLF